MKANSFSLQWTDFYITVRKRKLRNDNQLNNKFKVAYIEPSFDLSILRNKYSFLIVHTCRILYLPLSFKQKYVLCQKDTENENSRIKSTIMRFYFFRKWFILNKKSNK